jgi:uncharacterized protein HemX
MSQMSQNEKVSIAVVIVLVLAGLGYYWYQHTTATSSEETFVNTPATLPSGSDTSDQGLQQDTAAIDAQMTGLSSDQETLNSQVNAN